MIQVTFRITKLQPTFHFNTFFMFSFRSLSLSLSSSIKSAAACLDHVDEVGQGLLLNHWDSFEMSDQRVRQLGLVETRTGCHLEMLLVTPECVHLKVEEVHRVLARHGHLSVQRLLTVLSLPLLPDVLDDRLVKLADIVVLGLGVQGELELPLGDYSLYPLAVGGVGGGPVAGPPRLEEAAVEGGAVATVRASLLANITIQPRVTRSGHFPCSSDFLFS